MDALGKALFVEAEGERIGLGGSEVGQAVVELQHEDSRRQCACRNGGITALHPPKRVAADEEALRHVRGGDAALAPREREVTAQFAKRMGGRKRDRRSLWHAVMSDMTD